MDAPRRRLMLAAGAAALLPLAGCSESPVGTFADFDAVRRALSALGPQARTTAGWPLSQVLRDPTAIVLEHLPLEPLVFTVVLPYAPPKTGSVSVDLTREAQATRTLILR